MAQRRLQHCVQVIYAILHISICRFVEDGMTVIILMNNDASIGASSCLAYLSRFASSNDVGPDERNSVGIA